MLVLLCSAIVVVSFAMVRPKPTSFSNPSWYWQAKVEWKKCANIVLAGNSRTYRGLSPVEFERVLGGTAVNAGFSSGTYSKEYCDYLETLFDEDDTTPNILVAGITHGALCDLNSSNGFTSALKKSKESTLTGEQQQQTEEYNRALESLVAVYCSKQNENYIQEFFLNGWVASDYIIHNKTKYVDQFKSKLINGQRQCIASEVQMIVEWFSSIQSSGVAVICVWLPTCTEMSKVEDVYSRVKRDEVQKLFVDGGLTVLSYDDNQFTSYDGSHLSEGSAAYLSIMVAEQIKQSWFK
jgi:hypothetical protein